MTTPASELSRIVNQPQNWDFSGADHLFAGVDLGTYKAIMIIVDEKGKPRAARMRRAEVVRSGLIVDYAGAQNIVREMVAEMRQASPRPIEKGATSYPPQTEYANIDATRYILRMLGLPDLVAKALVQTPLPAVAAPKRSDATNTGTENPLKHPPRANPDRTRDKMRFSRPADNQISIRTIQ